MEFKYKAVKTSGERYAATKQAQDRYELARLIKDSGDTLISAEEVSDMLGKTSWMENINLVMTRVKLREKIMFARNLSAMLSGGLSVSRALGVLERQTKNQKFKEVISEMDEEIREGMALSEALKKHPKIFPMVFVSMVKAGEESGKLSEALDSIAVQMNKTYTLRRRIKGAMTYPSIIIVAMVVVGIVLMIFVVPTLTATFEDLGADLPASTQFIIGSSNFMKNNTLIFFVILIVIVGGAVVFLRHPVGKKAFAWFLLHFPVIKNMVKETNSAQTARTLSSLLNSGVEIVLAVGITKDVIQNPYFKEVLVKAELGIPKGESIASSFRENENLYPPLLSEMISVGEEAGNLPEMLLRVADFYEGEVEEKTKNLSTIIEPILMVLIGTVVGFFAVSMITPIYSLSSSI